MQLKRNFYLAVKAVQKCSYLPPSDIIKTIFPLSDVQPHIVKKYERHLTNSSSFIFALLTLYEGLDTDHQIMFDVWVNMEIEILEKTTIQYQSEDYLSYLDKLTKLH